MLPDTVASQGAAEKWAWDAHNPSGCKSEIDQKSGVDLQPTLDFARRLESLGRKMWIRFVLVPGLTDAPSNVEGLADFAASLKMVERVEVAPFHKLGEFKWQELRLSYKLADTQPPSPEALAEVKRAFSSRGLTVV